MLPDVHTKLSLSNNLIILVILQIQSPQPDKTRQGWYAAAAFTYLSAMVCGNMALRWIIYPTQVIAKSSKPIPVMLVGVLLANKRYRVQKYFFVLMIVIGVIMFIYKEGKAKARTFKTLVIVSLFSLFSLQSRKKMLTTTLV